MIEEPDAPRTESGRRRHVRRWAIPVALAVVVAGGATGARLAFGGERHAPASASTTATTPADGGTSTATPQRKPRFWLMISTVADPATAKRGTRRGRPSPWFQVRSAPSSGRSRVIASVPAPSPATGRAHQIVAAPDGTFVIASSRATPCESRLYRVGLTPRGRPARITPIRGGVTPALVAGLAISPDGRHIAYATEPCDPQSAKRAGAGQQGSSPAIPASPPHATLTMLDAATGNRRTWSASGSSVVGEIIWAGDNRTIGYTLGDVAAPTATTPASPGPDVNGPPVGGLAVHALDTTAVGTDLRSGRILFRAPGGSQVLTSVTMNLDGRTGDGVLEEGHPATTKLFKFGEGQPMRITKVFPPEPGVMRAFSSGGPPRYACATGIDAFGRVIRGAFVGPIGLIGVSGCMTAAAY
ncbi:hypothetical protein [Actinomadura sp. NPDC048394]|uniref:hypothetical protein n=1 Tax=Actinomadura sp. NPDC048394 TaxID=3158223 RepID=UPI0033DD6B99